MEISNKIMLPPLLYNTDVLWHVGFQSHEIGTKILVLLRYHHCR